MNRDSKIYVAGHNGMVGSALLHHLQTDGYTNIIIRTHNELDLTRQVDVEAFFTVEKPEVVFLLAARVGGIADNRDHPADALIINSLIEMNVIKTAFENGVKKLIFTSSLTIYPEVAPQPMGEELFLSGSLNDFLGGYSLAKAIGVRLCEYLHHQYGVEYTAAVLPNLYGENDRGTTVLPMLIQKFYTAVSRGADSVEVWGTGNARREFLHADDLIDALIFLINNYSGGKHINVGFGSDITIRELSELIKEISGFSGSINFNVEKPEGTLRKLLDSAKMFNLGWRPKIALKDGISRVYENYVRIQEKK